MREGGSGETDGNDARAAGDESHARQIADGEGALRDSPGVSAIIGESDVRLPATDHLIVAADGDTAAAVAEGKREDARRRASGVNWRLGNGPRSPAVGRVIDARRRGAAGSNPDVIVPQNR